MLDLLTDEETERIERRIQNNQRVNEKINNEYEIYKICIRDIERVLPILKEYGREKPEFEI